MGAGFVDFPARHVWVAEVNGMSDLEAVSDPFLASAAKRIPSIGGTMTTLSMKTYTRIYINIFIFLYT